jgi:hypothetical protein
VTRRPTLKGLMIVIVGVGLVLAALTRPNTLWAFALPIFFLTILLTAILAILYRCGQQRARWTGFALFGWAYFILSLFVKYPADAPPLDEQLIERLMLIPQVGMELASEDWGTITLKDFMNIGNELVSDADPVGRFLIVWSVAGLAFASLGGLMAGILSRRQSTQTREDARPNQAHNTAQP